MDQFTKKIASFVPRDKSYVVIELIEYARQNVARQINIVQILTYYALGKWIVEYQQNGQARAQYGKNIIELLSTSLTEKYGKGFSASNLEKAKILSDISEPNFGNSVYGIQ